jgi:hypothetical protein
MAIPPFPSKLKGHSSISRGDAHDNPYFHRKGAENAKGRVFLSFAEWPKDKKSIPSERQSFSFAVLPAP